MPVPCRFCEELIAFNEFVAGKRQRCTNLKCQKWNTLPLKEPRKFLGSTAAVPEIPELRGEPVQQAPRGSCPSCQRWISLDSIELPNGRCPYCHEHLDEESFESNEANCDDTLGEVNSIKVACSERQERQQSARQKAVEAVPIACWMRDWILKHQSLCHGYAVEEIRSRFGGQYIYKNRNGNPAIDPSILEEFERLTKKAVVWSNRGQCWRTRLETDNSDTRAVD